MKISIVIPTLNEEKCIGKLLDYLIHETKNADAEIIVADGGSSDNTASIVQDKNVKLIRCSKKGRANQLNEGAAIANGDTYYFVHADTFPPEGFINLIQQALSSGFQAGCFAYTFDPPKHFLKVNAWFTKFKGFYAGGGDQTLFITRSFFEELHGYNANYVIMEDFELVRRIRKNRRLVILKNPAVVSSRKYELNNYWKVQWANAIALLQFKFGVDPLKIKQGYKKRIRTT